MAKLRLCLVICKIIFECKIENILCKGKHFLLFDCVVEITPDNYFLCFFLDVKNLYSLENVSPS